MSGGRHGQILRTLGLASLMSLVLAGQVLAQGIFVPSDSGRQSGQPVAQDDTTAGLRPDDPQAPNMIWPAEPPWLPGLPIAPSPPVCPLLFNCPPPPRPIPPLPPPPPGPRTLRLRALDVTADVDGDVARVRVQQRFVNAGSRPAEGVYVFPLPVGATISGFQMRIDGEIFGAELLKAEDAYRIYEGIVARNRDPALLQYLGSGAIQARVFPVPPGEERRVELEYTQVLSRDGALWELELPSGGAPTTKVAVNLKGRGPLPTIYSPTHEVQISRQGTAEATIRYEGSDTDRNGDDRLRLLFGGARTDVSLSVRSYNTGREDGYFLLVMSPPADVAQSEVIPRDLVLVLDTSGSMAGRKIEQARSALSFVLDRLNPGDRFGVVAFSSGVQTFADALRPGTDAAAARQWVEDLAASGSTNIGAALQTAQDMLRGSAEPGRPQIVLFLTDGLPTVGVTGATDIEDLVRKGTGPEQQIFTFGVGYDVNTKLLDAIAARHRGTSSYVRPNEDLEAKVASFYQKVAQPLLTGLSLNIQGVRAYDLVPTPLPDLFAGQQLVVLGRYKGSGAATVTVTGRVGNQPRSYGTDDIGFAARDTAQDYIPRLWAGRKIGFLISQVRQGKPDPEVLKEIVDLSLRFGILTPYTSFLVQEPGAPALEQREQAAQKVAESAARAPASGQAAVDAASTVSGLQAAPSIAAQRAAAPAPAATASAPSAAPAGSGRSGFFPEPGIPAQGSQRPAVDDREILRSVHDKSFLWKDNTWTDTALGSGQPVTDVAFGSPEYFRLARQWPQYLAVGLPLRIVLAGQAYRITDTGSAAAPPAEPPVRPSDDADGPDRDRKGLESTGTGSNSGGGGTGTGGGSGSSGGGSGGTSNPCPIGFFPGCPSPAGGVSGLTALTIVLVAATLLAAVKASYPGRAPVKPGRGSTPQIQPAARRRKCRL